MFTSYGQSARKRENYVVARDSVPAGQPERNVRFFFERRIVDFLIALHPVAVKEYLKLIQNGEIIITKAYSDHVGYTS